MTEQSEQDTVNGNVVHSIQVKHEVVTDKAESLEGRDVKYKADDIYEPRVV